MEAKFKTPVLLKKMPAFYNPQTETHHLYEREQINVDRYKRLVDSVESLYSDDCAEKTELPLNLINTGSRFTSSEENSEVVFKIRSPLIKGMLRLDREEESEGL